MADRSRGSVILEEEDIQDEVFGVWIGNGDGVAVIPSTDAAWKSSWR